MCGIAGLIAPFLSPKVRGEAVGRMCNAMVHRGPDDEGISTEGDATLGMRRLAIFDPANGRQPMQSPDGRLTLVFNGAIYNFRDLRRQLAGSWDFRTECDTEVLLYQEYWRRIPLYRLNPTWLFQEGFKVAREPVYFHLKRLSDIAFSLVGLAVATPLIAVAMVAIRWEDRGPAFFAQTRVGLNQRRFRLFKLRTMLVDAGGGPLYTQPGDRRITRVGAFLRNTRLDELPQLWNVLRGDMSLIGPRAEWDRLVETYEREIPCYHFRHRVKPGITGWAQVNYPYGASIEDTARKLEYDLYYIRHFSFTLDAAIVLKTINTVLGRKGR